MIINWLVAALAQAVDFIINLFFGRFLQMDLQTMVNMFPLFSQGYSIFRGIGFGLTAVFATLGLSKFFVPNLFGGRESTDTPAGILLKTFMAAGLVWGGNYLSESIVSLAKIPFDSFLNLNSGSAVRLGEQISNMNAEDLIRGVATDATVIRGVLIIQLFLVSIIAYNLFKLLVEVCERYLMVGVLVFTSPPFFAMVATNDTMNSFMSWVKMFISSNVMMFVSVFFSKLIVSGIVAIGNNPSLGSDGTLVSLLLILAMCKIAQHIDSYLKQIGLGTAVTGGSLLDDILASGRSLGVVGGGGGRGNAGGVLGKAARAT